MSKVPEAQLRQAANIFISNGAAEVYLFGSQATGHTTDESDVDFAVVGLPPSGFFHALGEAWRILDRPIDLVDLDVDNPFTRHLKVQGKLVRVL